MYTVDAILLLMLYSHRTQFILYVFCVYRKECFKIDKINCCKQTDTERARLQCERRNNLQMQRQTSAAAEAGLAACTGAELFSDRFPPALSTQRPSSSGYAALNNNLSDQTIAKALYNSENENREDATYDDVEPAASSPLPRTQGSSNDLNTKTVRLKAEEVSTVAMAIVPKVAATPASQSGEIEHKQHLLHNIHNPFEEFAADFDNLLERNVEQLAGCLLKDGTYHLTVNRESVVADLTAAYKSNEDLCFKHVEITFSDATSGHSAHRLHSEASSTSSDRDKIVHETKMVLDLFWDRFLTKYFNGDCAMVLNDDIRSPDSAMWQAAGRILCHGLAMFGYVPVKLCRSSLYSIIFPKSDVTVEVLINDFLLFVTQPERELLQRALAERESEDDIKSLDLFFDHYDATDVVPSEYFTGLQIQLTRIARNCLKSEKLNFIYFLMWDGIPRRYDKSLAKYATLELLTHLYRKLTPKPQAVVEQLRFLSVKGEAVPFSESLRERDKEERQVLYYLRQSILTMTSDELATFLRAVTGVGSMPTATNHIRISFHQPATANTNSTSIMLSRNYDSVITLPIGRYSTWRQFNDNLVAVIRTDNNYRSSLVSDD